MCLPNAGRSLFTEPRPHALAVRYTELSPTRFISLLSSSLCFCCRRDPKIAGEGACRKGKPECIASFEPPANEGYASKVSNLARLVGYRHKIATDV